MSLCHCAALPLCHWSLCHCATVQWCQGAVVDTRGKNTSITSINKLQAIQNFAARIVTRSRKFDHITPILKQFCWMPVKDHLFYRDALSRFKCRNGMAPTNLSSRIIKRGTVSGRSTRNANKLDIPRYNNTTGQRGFLYRVATIWNNLPSDIKLSSSMNMFKR